MKALNHKKVIQGYLRFFGYLLLSVISVQLCVYSFFRTSEVEVAKIIENTDDSERIYNEQNSIVEGFDEIFNLYGAFELSEDVNPDFLMRSLVSRKMEVSAIVNRLPQEDVLLHAHLLSRLEDLLHVRDSISSLRKTEQTVKEDLIRCSGESRSITRKMRVGKMTYSKK
ncbi:MAG: hypothetical protein MJZ33_03695 [Paludibacteraceae bacterium]|nr:hypothetical protein [Paludibacteraceae bacterium]